MPRSVTRFSDAFGRREREMSRSVEQDIEQAVTVIRRVKEGTKCTISPSFPSTTARGPSYYCRATPADLTDPTQAIASFSTAG